MHAAQSFGYPFRAGAGRAWAAGVPLVLLGVLAPPLGVPLLLGYAARVTRAAAAAPGAAPPGLGLDARLVRDGLLLGLAAVLAAAPFAVLAALLDALLTGVLGGPLRAHLPAGADPALAGVLTALAAAGLAALPAGVAALLWGLPAYAAFALSGRARDLADAPAALRLVRARFAGWNLAGVAVVTAWALALAGAGLLCLGFLPGAFYAILVSAHAAASLAPPPPPAAPAPPAG